MNYSWWYSPKQKQNQTKTIISGISANMLKKMANNLFDIRLGFSVHETIHLILDVYFIFCHKAVPIISCLPFAFWNPNYDLFIVIEVFLCLLWFECGFSDCERFYCYLDVHLSSKQANLFIFHTWAHSQWAKSLILPWRLIQSCFQCSICYFGTNRNDKRFFRFECFWILRQKSFFETFQEHFTHHRNLTTGNPFQSQWTSLPKEFYLRANESQSKQIDLEIDLVIMNHTSDERWPNFIRRRKSCIDGFHSWMLVVYFWISYKRIDFGRILHILNGQLPKPRQNTWSKIKK